MSDPKNIDELFQDKFKDFEAVPKSDVWQQISDKLDAKEQQRKRRGIVFIPWMYRIAGAAAVLLLLLFLGNTFFFSDDILTNPTQTQTNSDTEENSVIEGNNSNTSNNRITDANTSEIHSTDDVVNADENSNSTYKNTHISNRQQNSNKFTKRPNAVSNNNSLANTQDNSSEKNTTLANRTNRPETNSNTNNSRNETFSQENYENAVSNQTKNAVAENSKNDETNTNNSSNTENDVSSTKNAIVANDAATSTKEETETAEKRSLLDVINELHDLEDDATEVAESSPKKWLISPSASPIYYNSFTNGSPIDAQFDDNDKSGDVNLSYGVNVGYNVSKKFTIRSGIHKVDYSYNTRDISVTPSVSGNIPTIASKNATSFQIKDREAAQASGAFSQYQLPTTESSVQQKLIEGDLSQRMSFIEIPVELKYALVDKKIGINLIGGMSTLLLTENSILIDSPELLAEIGEATNVNNISFSTNIGIGIDYKLSKQLELNLEPMLKYQLNTFSGNTGNFSPYAIGVYTGVSFRF